jgi:hypothetical protein
MSDAAPIFGPSRLLPLDNREKLEQFAAELRDLSTYDPPITPELVSYVAEALERFLAPDNTKSMDHAFGLVRRGRPPGKNPDPKMVDMAAALFEARARKISWLALQDKYGRDRKELVEIMERHREAAVRLIAERWMRAGG